MLKVAAAGLLGLTITGHVHAQTQPEPSEAVPHGAVTDGELTATVGRVDIVRSRSFREGTLSASVVIFGRIQGHSLFTIYAADRKLMVDEVLDQNGRSMLLPVSGTRESARNEPGWFADAYDFTELGSDARVALQCCPIRGEIAIDADPSRTVAMVSARFGSTIATHIEVIDLRISEIEPSEHMFQLVPGAHLAVPVLMIGEDGVIQFEYALWLHNDINDPSTVSPVIRSDQQMSDFYEDDRAYNLVGHDDREPPFLYSIEFIDGEGRLVGRVTDVATGYAHWTGHYWTSTDEVLPRSGTSRPEILRIRMITEAVRSELPIDLNNLHLIETGAGLPP